MGRDLTSYTTAPAWGKDAKEAHSQRRIGEKMKKEEEGNFPWGYAENSKELRGLPFTKYVKCEHCGRRRPAMRSRCVRRACESYGDLWAGDQRMRLFSALKAYGDERPNSQVTMVTVTAPGEDYGLVWDEHHCSWMGKHRHSGRIGCRVLQDVSEVWNSRAPKYWTALHESSVRAIQREGHDRPRLLVKAWEYQKRGLLHLHLVLGYTTPAERASVDAYVAALDGRRQRAGFGFVDRKGDVKEPTAAAAYLSSYFVAGKGAKLDIRETVRREDVPPHVIYIAPDLLQKSGHSMRSLRLRRYLWVKIGSSGLKLCKHLGISLEDAYLIYMNGFWGKAFLNVMVESHTGHF